MTLRMGDRAYLEAEWAPQYLHHPHAPVQYGLAELLRQAFVHTQAHARSCIQQSWGYDVQDLSGDLTRTRAMLLSSAVEYGGITRGWRRLPRETSHVEAFALVVLQVFAETEVRLRLTVIDASANTDQGEQTTIITQDARNGAGRTRVTQGQNVGASRNDLARLLDAEFPFAGPFRVHLVRTAVTLSNVDPDDPGLCEIRLEAAANRWTGADYAQPVAIQPMWAEVVTTMDDFGTALVDTTEGATTLSPLRIALGEGVLAEDVRRIHRAQDWAVQRRRTCHLSICTALDTWDDWSGGARAAVGPMGLAPTNTMVIVVSTDLWVPVEQGAGDISCGVECVVATAGTTVRLVFTFIGGTGTAAATVDCTSAENGTEVVTARTLAPISAGGEWVHVSITMQRIAGAAACEVRQIRVEENELATLLGPAND